MNRWIILLLLLSGCGENNKAYRPASQEIRLNLATEPPSIDPRKAMDTTSLAVINLCFEGLTRSCPGGKMALAAAEKVDISPDQKRYIFTLRNAKWSDGTPVTANDFEKTWKTVLDPAFPSDYANDLYFILNAKAAKTHLCPVDEIGIAALDEKTLRIDLEHPTPYFLEILSTPSFFATPDHIIKQYRTWTIEHYVGNGPFAMKEWKSHDRIILEKNPHYWDKENTKLERITFAMVEDQATELAMYENGELDWAGSPFSYLPTEALPSLSKNRDLHDHKISAVYYYIFNTQAFPFQNVNMRKAFSLAINREAIVANITQMEQSPAMGLIPPTMWQENLPYFKDGDTQEAKRLFKQGLEDLSLTAEQLPPIVLSYNTIALHHKIAQAIQEQWSTTFGIPIKLENKEWKVYLDDLRHHQFQVARMAAIAKFNDPISLLDFYRYESNSFNLSQWNHPQFTHLLNEADKTADPNQRTGFLREAEKIFMEEMPIAPIYYYTEKYLQKPYVKGIHFSKLGKLDLKWAYIEEANDQAPQ